MHTYFRFVFILVFSFLSTTSAAPLEGQLLPKPRQKKALRFQKQQKINDPLLIDDCKKLPQLKSMPVRGSLDEKRMTSVHMVKNNLMFLYQATGTKEVIQGVTFNVKKHAWTPTKEIEGQLQTDWNGVDVKATPPIIKISNELKFFNVDRQDWEPFQGIHPFKAREEANRTSPIQDQGAHFLENDEYLIKIGWASKPPSPSEIYSSAAAVYSFKLGSWRQINLKERDVLYWRSLLIGNQLYMLGSNFKAVGGNSRLEKARFEKLDLRTLKWTTLASNLAQDTGITSNCLFCDKLIPAGESILLANQLIYNPQKQSFQSFEKLKKFVANDLALITPEASRFRALSLSSSVIFFLPTLPHQLPSASENSNSDSAYILDLSTRTFCRFGIGKHIQYLTPDSIFAVSENLVLVWRPESEVIIQEPNYCPPGAPCMANRDHKVFNPKGGFLIEIGQDIKP